MYIVETGSWVDSKIFWIIFFEYFISSLDKALHSLGYKFGYALPKSQLPNPINIVMVCAQKVMTFCMTCPEIEHLAFTAWAQDTIFITF